MRQQIRLTESELQNIIEESVRRVIAENMEDENWFGDKLKQGKSAVGTALNGNVGSFKQRLTNARKNWKAQGELNDINNLIQQLSQFVDARQISPQTTVAQLIGGKYNNNRYGRMTSVAGNRQSQIAGRGGTAY